MIKGQKTLKSSCFQLLTEWLTPKDVVLNVHYFECRYLRKKASEINIIVALIMVHCDEKWPEGKLSCVQLLSSRTGVYFQALYTYGTSQVMDVGRRHRCHLLKPVLNQTFQILNLCWKFSNLNRYWIKAKQFWREFNCCKSLFMECLSLWSPKHHWYAHYQT